MPTDNLNQADVAKLLSDPTPDNRAATAAKVAVAFDPARLSPNERALAEEIFRLMVKDAEVRVRQALAENLKQNGNVPHDVALALANDVDQVALPMIEFSQVLNDDDLIAIIGSQDPAKQEAVAGRATVSEAISDALVGTGNEAAVTRLVANEGAAISERAFQKVVDDFGDREPMQTAMVNRSSLPVTVAERLVTLVSENLRDELVKRHELPASMATDIIMQSRERATISLSSDSGVDDVMVLVRQLHEHGRLTPSITLRALCMGDITFFECAMATLGGVTLENARRLIHDRGPLGLRAIFDKAKLPPAQFMAVRAALDVSRETEMDGGENDRERYARRMIERIMTQYDDLGVEFESSDLEYLLTKMDELPPDVLGDDGPDAVIGTG
ncbi:MAG: hypothetical protein COW30_12150 [Rhodospirillales bacterium CG15_BIG_FIL_POST_REV_8_21_14_020_66_15]|nr:MAG: hypothetical protein COW30_12150 [Rhodospirillales bacterium CG15_BIG_FIL_POST_REV_8_21_14_020_66_15]